MHNPGCRHPILGVCVPRGLPCASSYEDFLTGFVIDDAHVWRRPVGVTAGKNGSLFVSEDANGTIWRVSSA
jgi:glucose/arabinose dehydrogenase